MNRKIEARMPWRWKPSHWQAPSPSDHSLGTLTSISWVDDLWIHLQSWHPTTVHLPAETWIEICKYVELQDDLAQLAVVSKYLNPIVTEALYKTVALSSPRALRSFHAALNEYPHRAAWIRDLRIEWTEETGARVPQIMGQWFVEIIDALRDGKTEHLSFLVFPRDTSTRSGVSNSKFEGAIKAYIKTLGLTGIHLAQSVRTVDTSSHLFRSTLIPDSPGKPVAPLVALSLHGVACLRLEHELYPEIRPMAATLRSLRIALRHPVLHHPLWVCFHVRLRLPKLELLEFTEVEPVWKAPHRSMSRFDRLGMFGPNSFKHLNKDLPRLRTLVWFPAWGDVEDLGPGMQYVEDVREDVFAFLKVRTFAVMLPRERCVRFESSKEEPHYTIVPRNRFDDLGWRAT